MKHPSRLRPYHIRPGARFRCFGDGFCCSDIHAVGPLDKRAITSLTIIAPEAICYSEVHDAHVMVMRPSDGSCVFLDDDAGCKLHSMMDGALKPGPCIRFPYGLTATPRGGRITTDHRCCCRTLGDRPPVELESALHSLREGGTRAPADHRVDAELRISKRKRASFDEWQLIEAELLEALARGDDPTMVLGVEPFPPLKRGSYEALAESISVLVDSSRIAAASVWFGDGVRAYLGQRVKTRPRPWADSFARAEARTLEPETPRAIVNDWLADSIWAMRWTAAGSFERAKAELATRIYIAEHISKRLRRKGLRADVAMAEAIMVVEVVGSSDVWEAVVEAIDL